ncbi:endolytic transglycosylase MltG [Companilactobacillus sp.]|uniref:endolytic transglycosylase MltG n=1 Tax=Companilactobacillus sp. TaxID=2767905 RepID=UPI0025BB51E2|nr:endolytic transglycosylase MltG [Companilactobacillus sp.]MCH4008002.1 endolytic transglycosylase MltG [Companilactobacillus sp.]MCH4051819.1 endolytic transglycosylase MltG [Companilactobacillus sp.]MCH4075945.1 endolytic transglycosylase MltG [Companilactobacillus sp.]MCH4124520.1 endolytic transglycosylase MltG [Companilactobacillus sp.]MCH4132517.1 endolytic transglycosylase MltG [Companilactobacillus sp.]
MSQKDEKKDALKRESQDKITTRARERSVANHIAYWIVGVIAVLAVIVAIIGFNYVNSSLQPYNSNSKEDMIVKIPAGSSSKDIAKTLESDKVIKSATVFNYYIKAHNYTDFQAGYYTFNQSMSMSDIVNQLQKGGSAEPTGTSSNTVLVREGVTIDQIGDQIQKSTKFKKSDFLKLMKDQSYMKQLQKKYPELLDSSMANKNVRYHLEGYLFPATYGVFKGMTLKQLVDQMVAKENTVLQPYYSQMKEKDMTVQETLTLASLVEREGLNMKDRQKIAGVFYNRFDANMPLQSDISVMYALNTHKTSLSNKDTSVKSPYNLYKNRGYGPGPFNSPSLQSIQATLNPTDRSAGYLYFFANLKTGKVTYSTTFSQHQNRYDTLDQ